ncbi:hypothetical protein RJJ65_14125 [Rhizobium hidalgonense]|uniref:Uncharacterized protein n=1 Tax=Rhizobium hidalgonense TaxID=1538159 RepID=A0AAJ2GWH6_9HYPH|nr:hypothetical protein [Rhizobium hidalgonense]MDR9773788.1 hypothetical protein [Rhizobium hidalgonense]
MVSPVCWVQPREKRPAMILNDILAFGIVVYVVLDCFDRGVGIRADRGMGDLTPTMRETGGPGF